MKRKFNPKKFIRFILTLCVLGFILLSVSLYYFLPNVNTYRETILIEYCVGRGDTYWSIAEEYCPEYQDISEYIYNIRKLNKILPQDLQPGDILNIPVAKGD